MNIIPLLSLIILLLGGCAASSSRWRDDAYSRFNSAVTAGSQDYAPEETENIRQTLALAERYFTKQQREDADRLYQLSCQKSQLLYRNLVLSKVRPGSSLAVQREVSKGPEKITRAPEAAGNRDVAGQSDGKRAAAEGVLCDETPEIESRLDKPVLQAVTVCPSADRHTADTVAVTASPAAASSGVISLPGSDLKCGVTQEPVMGVRKVLSPAGPKKLAARASTVSKHGKPGNTTIYLTFDDGPSRLTLPIASYLNSQGISATFFALGRNIIGHERVVRETVALGHRVGNHTLSHDLKKLKNSLYQGHNEIEQTAVMLDRLGGDGKMVRIPYGAVSKSLMTTVASEGGQIFDWDINSLDSSRRGAGDHFFIERTVVQQLQKSGKRHIIMLFHDGAGHDATLAAIRNLVPRLKQEGYRFGLLSRSDRVAQSRAERNPTP